MFDGLLQPVHLMVGLVLIGVFIGFPVFIAALVRWVRRPRKPLYFREWEDETDELCPKPPYLDEPDERWKENAAFDLHISNITAKRPPE